MWKTQVKSLLKMEYKFLLKSIIQHSFLIIKIKYSIFIFQHYV